MCGIQLQLYIKYIFIFLKYKLYLGEGKKTWWRARLADPFSTRAKLSLIFQDSYRVFCLSCKIVSHFLPHTSFFRQMYNVFVRRLNALGYIGPLTTYSFVLLDYIYYYSVNARGLKQDILTLKPFQFSLR